MNSMKSWKYINGYYTLFSMTGWKIIWGLYTCSFNFLFHIEQECNLSLKTLAHFVWIAFCEHHWISIMVSPIRNISLHTNQKTDLPANSISWLFWIFFVSILIDLTFNVCCTSLFILPRFSGEPSTLISLSSSEWISSGLSNNPTSSINSWIGCFRSPPTVFIILLFMINIFKTYDLSYYVNLIF